MASCDNWVRRHLSLRRILFAVIAVLLLGPVVREVFRDVYLIDTVAVPKRFADEGVSSGVFSSRVADRVDEIERAAPILQKDRVALAANPSSLPDVEVPATRLSPRAIAEYIAMFFHREPKRINGDIVFRKMSLVDNTREHLSITLREFTGQVRVWTELIETDDIDPQVAIDQCARLILRKINPFILGLYALLNEHNKSLALGL